VGDGVAEDLPLVRPGGELRFNEHIASERPLGRALQRTADATIWPTLFGGCHLGRDTRTALEHGGFRFEPVEQFVFRVSALDPPKTHILCTARRV
jgi:hypothetical protein